MSRSDSHDSQKAHSTIFDRVLRRSSGTTTSWGSRNTTSSIDVDISSPMPTVASTEGTTTNSQDWLYRTTSPSSPVSSPPGSPRPTDDGVAREPQSYSTVFSDPEMSPIWQKQCILSLDGGGIRGYSTLLILKRLLQEIENLETSMDTPSYSSWDSPLLVSYEDSNDDEKTRRRRFLPCHYFDLIAGTSTGGLVAILLGRLRLSVDEALNSFRNIWIQLGPNKLQHRLLWSYFKPSRKKDQHTKIWKEALEDMLRHSRTESALALNEKTSFQQDPRLCKTMVLTLKIDPQQGERYPYFLCSNEHDDKETRILDVCLASTAAPKYLRSHLMPQDNRRKYRDASAMAPDTYQQLSRKMRSDPRYYHTEDPIGCIVSVGCGTTRALDPPHPELHSSHPPVHRFIGPQLSDLTNDWQIGEDIKVVFENIQSATDAYITKHAALLRSCAKQLVTQRRERWRTREWERYALGVAYRCVRCEAPPERDREGLVRHLLEMHNDKDDKYDHFDRNLYARLDQDLKRSRHSVGV